MSRVVTPPLAQPATPVKVPHEAIAMRAYEKWCRKGRPHGSQHQDWLEAEAELKAELHRTIGATLARHGKPAPPNQRLWGTAAAVTASILNGAHIVRVHDVPEMLQVARVSDALLAVP